MKEQIKQWYENKTTLLTKGGQKARLICIDRKINELPVKALVENDYGYEYSCSMTSDLICFKNDRLSIVGEYKSPKNPDTVDMELPMMLSKAIAFATKMHEGQVTRDGMPYILHPLHVMNMVDTVEEKIVAVLHDVVEDTNATHEDIHNMFGEKISDGVFRITRPKNYDRVDFCKEMTAKNELARIVKIADLTHNMDIMRLDNPTDKDWDRMKQYHEMKKYLENYTDDVN